LANPIESNDKSIAYFSMEIGLESGMPTYSGGLGVLAGDTIRAAADLKIPLIGVTLVHRKGYFDQKLGADGSQREEPANWALEDFLTEMPARATVNIEGRRVKLRSWKYEAHGTGEFDVPVFFLDTDLPENAEWDRSLTNFLYGGDQRYRLAQEVVLGMGGVRMLRALGYADIARFHMNEGHASLLVLELLDEEVKRTGRAGIEPRDVDAVKKKCIFTTHTPVAAGHDQFPMELVNQVVGRHELYEMQDLFCCGERLNMTYLALNLSQYVNGVAKRHGETSRLMFAGYHIDAITNGIHAASWTAPAFSKLFDRYIPGWKQDNFSLRYALSIPKEQIWQAHAETKKSLLGYVQRATGIAMDPDILTVGFARRAAAYKRGDLLFSDLNRLNEITSRAGPFQIVYAGKAHPQDQAGKELIKRIFRAIQSLRNKIKIVYLENYDLELGKMLTSGVDVWLNTPQPPLEASGTSGMKAAVNGVPSFSVLDGWWFEGWIEGVTGWSIGPTVRGTERVENHSTDALSLYEKLEQVVLPLFYRDRSGFVEVMRHAIALNGSFFNTHRMLQQYVVNAYF
jgi:glycogen phosphorylase